VDGPFATTSMDLMLQAALERYGSRLPLREPGIRARIVRPPRKGVGGLVPPTIRAIISTIRAADRLPTALRAFIDYVRRKDEPHQSQIG